MSGGPDSQAPGNGDELAHSMEARARPATALLPELAAACGSPAAADANAAASALRHQLDCAVLEARNQVLSAALLVCQQQRDGEARAHAALAQELSRLRAAACGAPLPTEASGAGGGSSSLDAADATALGAAAEACTGDGSAPATPCAGGEPQPPPAAFDAAPSLLDASGTASFEEPGAAAADDNDELPPLPSSLADDEDGAFAVFPGARRFQGAWRALSATTPAQLLAGGAAGALGSGGQGSVTLVRLEGAEGLPQLAIKRMQEPVKYRDFVRECEAWAAWWAAFPPYVLPLLAAQFVRRKPGSSRGTAFFAMPACSEDNCLAGEAVRMDMEREMPSAVAGADGLLPGHATFTRRTLASLLVALEAAAVEGVVWGNLKPPNIMMPPGERPQIIDFGSASRLAPGGGGLRHAPPQSKGYAAPECSAKQSKGWVMGCAIDTWALGCLAARLALGVNALMAAAGDSDVVRPEALGGAWPPGVAPALRALVFDGLLLRDPAARLTPTEAMGHEFFQGLDWAAVRSGAAWRRGVADGLARVLSPKPCACVPPCCAGSLLRWFGHRARQQ
ncbi:MAG: kinase-like domain-containing protein [Monoraphidium minutum]|nr:MAG: kinase-like domain-containing protein [Monoraphidium minutum]